MVHNVLSFISIQAHAHILVNTAYFQLKFPFICMSCPVLHVTITIVATLSTVLMPISLSCSTLTFLFVVGFFLG